MPSLRELFAGVRNTFARGHQNAHERDDALSEQELDSVGDLPVTQPAAPSRYAMMTLVYDNQLDKVQEAFETYDLKPTELLHFVQSPEMVDLLIEKGADVNERAVEGHDIFDENEHVPPVVVGAMPLHVAAREANASTVQRLIDHGADLEATYVPWDETENPLLIAVRTLGDDEHEQVVRTLLDAGANPNAYLHQQQESRHTARMVTNVQYDDVPILCSAITHYGPIGSIQALLEHGADPNRPELNERGQPIGTALHVAAEEGRTDVADLLLNYGANVHGVKEGDELTYKTPLQLAALNGHMETLDKLVSRGADPAGVNSLTPEGDHMLAVAATRGYLDATRSMIERNADVNLAMASPVWQATPRENIDPKCMAEVERGVLRQTTAEVEQQQSPDVAEAPTQPVARRRVRL